MCLENLFLKLVYFKLCLYNEYKTLDFILLNILSCIFIFRVYAVYFKDTISLKILYNLNKYDSIFFKAAVNSHHVNIDTKL